MLYISYYVCPANIPIHLATYSQNKYTKQSCLSNTDPVQFKYLQAKFASLRSCAH